MRERWTRPSRTTANPLPLLLPAIDLLESVGLIEPAKRILTALQRVLTEGKIRTPDLGGGSSTTEVAEAIAAQAAP